MTLPQCGLSLWQIRCVYVRTCSTEHQHRHTWYIVLCSQPIFYCFRLCSNGNSGKRAGYTRLDSIYLRTNTVCMLCANLLPFPQTSVWPRGRVGCTPSWSHKDRFLLRQRWVQPGSRRTGSEEEQGGRTSPGVEGWGSTRGAQKLKRHTAWEKKLNSCWNMCLLS